MSISWSARLIAGVRLETIYNEDTVNGNITKYDEDTGKPYQVVGNILERHIFGIQLKTVPYVKQKYGGKQKVNRDWDFLDSCGLGIYFPSYIDEYTTSNSIMSDGVVGFLVNTSNDYNKLTTETSESLLIEQLREVDIAFKKLKSKFGLYHNIGELDIKPQIIVQLAIS